LWKKIFFELFDIDTLFLTLELILFSVIFVKIRYKNLDAIRGLALSWMIAFHANYLLENVFGIWVFHFSDIFWFTLGKLVAILFILVAGISLFVSVQEKNFTQILKSNSRRFGMLALIAGGISFVTYTFFYEQRISWGIIHFFALATLFGVVFLRFWILNILLGLWCIGLWYYLNSISADSILWIPFWLYPPSYFSADYYPLFPWFGYYLIWYGSAFWLSNYWIFDSIFTYNIFEFSLFEFMWRHSLLIYVLHVPIIFAVIQFIFLLKQ
jgi:uncharacterized membrane protein